MKLGVADPARVATPVAIGLGLLALAARVPSQWAILITAAVGLVGLITPVPARPAATAPAGIGRVGTWIAAAALGIGALLIAGRLPGVFGIVARPAGLAIPRARPEAVVVSVIAAVSEEIFFRRLLYGWLLTWGTASAVCGSALAFAAVHVPVYGFAVLPIDAAAGLLLGWQRWMTGGWSASALTHSMANLIAEGVIP